MYSIMHVHVPQRIIPGMRPDCGCPGMPSLNDLQYESVIRRHCAVIYPLMSGTTQIQSARLQYFPIRS